MSLHIDTDRVLSVLLTDGWHHVMPKSFELDAYEFQSQGETSLQGGQVAGLPSMGATWLDGKGGRIYCPLNAVLAVQTDEK